MLGQAKKCVGGDSFLYFMNYHSSNRSIYCFSSVNKHSIPLQWHLVRNLRGSIVGGLHQSGCTCRLVVVLKEHSLERPLRPGIKASRQMLPPPSLSVKKSIPHYVKSRKISFSYPTSEYGVVVLAVYRKAAQT